MPTHEDAPKTLTPEQRRVVAALSREYRHRVMVWWVSGREFALTFVGEPSPAGAILVEAVG